MLLSLAAKRDKAPPLFLFEQHSNNISDTNNIFTTQKERKFGIIDSIKNEEFLGRLNYNRLNMELPFNCWKKCKKMFSLELYPKVIF